MFQNLAHRGASHYCPENTRSAFYQALALGANGIETDVRTTKDGQLVLFHDESIARVTGRRGNLVDYTYEEMLDVPIRHDKAGACLMAQDRLMLLNDFLKYIRNETVALAIELKEDGTEEAVLELLTRYGVMERVTVTSFSFERLALVRQLNRYTPIGFLSRTYNQAILDKLKTINCGQFCPKAEWLDSEMVTELRKQNFSIRAWGVKDEATMERVYGLHIDGMTVNFPDKLCKLMERNSGSPSF